MRPWALAGLCIALAGCAAPGPTDYELDTMDRATCVADGILQEDARFVQCVLLVKLERIQSQRSSFGYPAYYGGGSAQPAYAPPLSPLPPPPQGPTTCQAVPYSAQNSP